MNYLDYLIIAAYLISMVLVGIYFQRKASESSESYFLGNNKIPWWALGASGMASNLDVSGTMINVAMLYSMGIVGFFIEIRGGLVLVLAFYMIFMGKWNRRAKVMTMAEWMKFRFGDDIQGKTARIVTAFAMIFINIAIITYFAFGSGKFIAEFLNLPNFFGMSSEFWASTLMIFIAMIYTVTSGLYGVVWTDVFQGVLIFAVIVIVCFITFTKFSLPEIFSVSVPLNNGSFQTIATTKNEWTNIFPKWNLLLPENSTYSIYNLFGVSIIFYLIKTTIEGSGGSGGYMVQRFYASRSDREAGLLSLFWTFLLSFRWPFIAAIALMGISLGSSHGEIIADPERVLPIVINEFIPNGLKGLMVSGLIAAAMSTFDSLVNSGAAYWVKDIYQYLINPKATEKQLVFQSRLSSIIMVLIGLLFTLSISSINEIWGWLTMGIGAGLIAPLFIRWYWWRMNGFGFSFGILFGMIAALIMKFYAPYSEEYINFVVVFLSSVSATIIFSLLTEATDQKVLVNFFKITRPFGFWNKVRADINPDEIIEIRKENRMDIIAVLFAVPWQIILFLTGMAFIIKRWDYFALLVILLTVLSVGLYFTWFKHLSKEKGAVNG